MSIILSDFPRSQGLPKPFHCVIDVVMNGYKARGTEEHIHLQTATLYSHTSHSLQNTETM